jgi:putative salt-induced outer membrane protein YdiY
MPKLVAATVAISLAGLAVTVRAQNTCPCPPEPKPGWHGDVGAGLSFTSGNNDTSNVSLSFEAKHDPKKKNVFKADGLWIRNKTEGELSADRVNLGARDEYTLSKRGYLFGELRYLRDRFKDLSYLVTPLVGTGYRLVDTEKTRFAADVAIGGAFEKDYGQDATSDGSFRLGESFSQQLSSSAKLTQAAWGLWKMADTSDSFYHLELALAASISSKLELKVALVDDYQNQTASPELKKNDTAFVVNLVFKL